MSWWTPDVPHLSPAHPAVCCGWSAPQGGLRSYASQPGFQVRVSRATTSCVCLGALTVFLKLYSPTVLLFTVVKTYSGSCCPGPDSLEPQRPPHRGTFKLNVLQPSVFFPSPELSAPRSVAEIADLYLFPLGSVHFSR